MLNDASGVSVEDADQPANVSVRRDTAGKAYPYDRRNLNLKNEPMRSREHFTGNGLEIVGHLRLCLYRTAHEVIEKCPQSGFDLLHGIRVSHG